MPTPKVDLTPEEVEENDFEAARETHVRVKDLREKFFLLLFPVLFAALALYVAVDWFRDPVSPIWAVLGLELILVYGTVIYTDRAVCLVTSRHTCRMCERASARWKPGEEHRTLYERTTDRIADAIRPRLPNFATGGLPMLVDDEDTREGER